MVVHGPASHRRRRARVAVVDLGSMQVVRRIDVASLPQEILIHPDGKIVYASCADSGKVAAIDLAR